MVHCSTAQTFVRHPRLAIAVGLWLTICSGAGFAFEPFRVDPTLNTDAQESSRIDHLEPIGRPFQSPPEFQYLAQYWAQISNEEYHYVAVVRKTSSGQYYVQQGDAPKSDLHGKPYQFKREAEISIDTAQLIYEYWVNMLLETGYDRKHLPYMSPTTVYMFSTFVPGLGWLHGYTQFPGVSQDMPPYWMSQAGEGLFEFITKSHDEGELRTRIKAARDKFYDYARKRSVSASTR